MRITELKYTERKNTGSYQFAELTATAAIEDGEDVNASILTLQTFVKNSLDGEISNLEVSGPVTYDEKSGTNIPVSEVVKEEKPKQKRKPKAEKVEAFETNEEVIPPVIETPKAKKSNVVSYDSSIQEHKGMFGSFLTQSYGDKWKTVASPAEIKAFTSSLNGQPFVDDSGKMVPTFIEMIQTFFGVINA